MMSILPTCIYMLYINRYCESRRQVVLDHVYEGYDLDVWEFME